MKNYLTGTELFLAALFLVRLYGRLCSHTGPPDVRYARPVSPGPGYVWVSGDWEWSGGKYHWQEGYWQQPRPGHTWKSGYWENDAKGL